MLLQNMCQRVPEGQPIVAWHEARSAWESVPRKNRPVGHGTIGQLIPGGQPAIYEGILDSCLKFFIFLCGY
jgi:hypothetical protein